MGVSLLIKRITLAALVAAFAVGMLAVPASSNTGPIASASKCKKAKKGKHRKKKKKCRGGSPSSNSLPGQATHATPTQSPPPPPALGVSGIGVTDNPVLAGDSTTGQVTVDRAAPAGGQTVTLQSDQPGRAAVPASVVVAAGATSASFPVDTTAGATVTTTLTASIGASNDNTQLSVVSAPSVDSLSLERQCFTGLGSFGSNRVSLDVPAATDTAVTLLSGNPIALIVPPAVTVPSGSSSALFSVTTLAPSPPVTVTATLGSSQATDSASVSLTSPDPDVSGLDLSPGSVTGGNPSTATVTIDCEAPSGGAVVDVSSSLAGVTVPAHVTVPQGQLSTTFQVTTLATASGDATITASRGSSQHQAVLHVNNLGT
jgi:hypothetical protein